MSHPRHVRSAPCVLLAAAALAAGCGTGATARKPAPTGSPLDPAVGGHELMELKRVGATLGASDLVKYGSDGSVVIIQSYGGGGTRVRRCTLRAGELPRLRRDLARLPLDAPVAHGKSRRRSTFYTAPPAQYTLRAGTRTETFTQTEMPRDAQPLVVRLRRTLSGAVARCTTTSATRRS